MANGTLSIAVEILLAIQGMVAIGKHYVRTSRSAADVYRIVAGIGRYLLRHTVLYLGLTGAETRIEGGTH